MFEKEHQAAAQHCRFSLLLRPAYWSSMPYVRVGMAVIELTPYFEGCTCAYPLD